MSDLIPRPATLERLAEPLTDPTPEFAARLFAFILPVTAAIFALSMLFDSGVALREVLIQAVVLTSFLVLLSTYEQRSHTRALGLPGVARTRQRAVVRLPSELVESALEHLRAALRKHVSVKILEPSGEEALAFRPRGFRRVHIGVRDLGDGVVQVEGAPTQRLLLYDRASVLNHVAWTVETLEGAVQSPEPAPALR